MLIQLCIQLYPLDTPDLISLEAEHGRLSKSLLKKDSLEPSEAEVTTVTGGALQGFHALAQEEHQP